MEANQTHLIVQKMGELNRQIKYYNRKYYEEEISEIADFEYDLLFQELKQLEEEYPQLKLSDSVTDQVGYKSRRNFPSFTHPVMMGSLNNAFSIEDVMDFLEKKSHDLDGSLEDLFPISLSLKFDGLALELVYKNGVLAVGATRGDGIIGDNVTANVKKIEEIPHQITKFSGRMIPEFLVVRGEVVMDKKEFGRLNQELEEKGALPASNPRNLVSGMMRQINSDWVSSKLHFFSYQLTNWEDFLPGHPECYSHEKQVDFLSRLGFNCNEYNRTVHRVGELKDYLNHALTIRNDLSYEIDGVVIKIDNGKIQKKLGEAGKRPRYAIAWKLPPEIKTTKLLEVEFNVGRTGKITPVGILKPVRLGGAVVRRVTLHNLSEMTEKKLKLGDVVKVIRSGDVIPKIMSNEVQHRTGDEREIEFPTDCPICTSQLQQEEILTFCINPHCPAQQYHHMVHFVSKEAMNMDGLGKEIIKELLVKKKIVDVSDLFYLSYQDLEGLDRMGDKSKTNLIDSITRARRVRLDRFIFSMGIHGVGQKISQTIARNFNAIDLLMSLTSDQLMERLVEIDEIGLKTAQRVVDFFTSDQSRKMIRKMIAGGVELVVPPQNRKKISLITDKKIHFTGKLSIPRNIAKERAESSGAEILTSISKNLDFLIVGEKPGSKLKKASELGISILSEEDFLKMTY